MLSNGTVWCYSGNQAGSCEVICSYCFETVIQSPLSPLSLSMSGFLSMSVCSTLMHIQYSMCVDVLITSVCVCVCYPRQRMSKTNETHFFHYYYKKACSFTFFPGIFLSLLFRFTSFSSLLFVCFSPMTLNIRICQGFFQFQPMFCVILSLLISVCQVCMYTPAV